MTNSSGFWRTRQRSPEQGYALRNRRSCVWIRTKRLARLGLACDSQPVSGGRGRRLITAAIASLACVLVPATTGIAGNAVHLSSKGKLKFVFLKARVGSDGFVTPGRPETIAISRMAPRAPIKVFVEAPPTTRQCGELFFCDPAPTSPVPGSPPYRANAKGKATLTFVMPSTYFLETDPFDPKVRQPVTFADQQRIHIDVEGTSKIKNVRRESFGFARTIVRLPSS